MSENMILSSPCWKKAVDFADPAFRRAYDLFVDQRDQFGGYLMRQLLHISADDFHVLMINPAELPVFSPTGAPSAPAAADTQDNESASGFPYMAVVPFTVCPEVCDDAESVGHKTLKSSDNSSAEVGKRYMVESAATALMDMITSFHIILANFPNTNGHVSLSIQTNHMGKMECGKTYLGVSRIDKMGRRIVYCSVDFVEPQLQPMRGQDGETALPVNTPAELLTAMKSATVLANVKHVKSMLSFS